MTRPDAHAERACRFEADIPAYLQGELAPGKQQSFEAHLATCPRCRAETEAYHDLIARLTAPPVEGEERDLAPAVLARIDAAEHLRRPALETALLRAAAVLACCVLAGLLVVLLRPGPAPRDRFVAEALDWLHATQEPQGHWDAGKWGGQAPYTPGISALAVLAFLEDDPDVLRGPHGEAVRRGVEYLLAQQSPDGRFGPLCNGTPYNQGLATLAVLRAARRDGDPRWAAAADRALAYIKSTQLLSGGWGYARLYEDTPNTSVTAWQMQALLEAQDAGRQDLRPEIRRGLAWFGRMMDADGRVGYARPGQFPNGHLTLTAAAALCLQRASTKGETPEQLVRAVGALRRDADPEMDIDYYRYYFLVPALAAGGGDAASMASRLRESLLTCQVRAGRDTGSCELRDTWSKAGGRVYTTAMAVLAM